MACVLETNVLVSAALGDGPARRLLTVLAQRGELVTSRYILDELLRVFRDAPQLRKVPPLAAARLAAFTERHARLVEPARIAWKDDPGDAAVLGTALMAKAILVTGDRKMLEAAPRFGVQASTVRQVLDDLDA